MAIWHCAVMTCPGLHGVSAVRNTPPMPPPGTWMHPGVVNPLEADHAAAPLRVQSLEPASKVGLASVGTVGAEPDIGCTMSPGA